MREEILISGPPVGPGPNPDWKAQLSQASDQGTNKIRSPIGNQALFWFVGDN